MTGWLRHGKKVRFQTEREGNKVIEGLDFTENCVPNRRSWIAKKTRWDHIQNPVELNKVHLEISQWSYESQVRIVFVGGNPANSVFYFQKYSQFLVENWFRATGTVLKLVMVSRLSLERFSRSSTPCLGNLGLLISYVRVSVLWAEVLVMSYEVLLTSLVMVIRLILL